MNFEDFERTARLLTTCRWVFAKTMAQNPHHYTLRKEWLDGDFTGTVELMRAHGYVEKFAGRPYTQFNVNCFKHWTMGAPIEQTILINKKHLGVDGGKAAFDAVAQSYDDYFSDAESIRENERLFNLIPYDSKDTVLDIGCGSGLFLDYIDELQAESYVGVDPSRAMLDCLVRKHSDYEYSVVQSKFEDYYSEGKRFDLIVSLFGSANYIQPEALSRIPKLLAPSGRYFIMFYQPDYSPVLYSRSGRKLEHYTHALPPLPGSTFDFGNFYIVEGGNE